MNKLFKYAIITSPLLAIYVASPLYIFNILPLEKSIMVFLSALFSIVMYWAFNGYLLLYSKIKSKPLIYILSYFFAYFSNIFKIILGEDFRVLGEILIDYIIYPLSVTVVINTIILIIINSLKQEQEKQLAYKRIVELKLENLKAQKQTLTQQLQPHFLFNALSILKSLIHDDKELAETYTVQLSNFLRYSVDSHNTDLATIEAEMNFVDNYINLQKIRFDDSFNYTSNLPQEILKYKVPILAIQTLVENAFKHNYFTKKNKLSLSISYQDEYLIISNTIGSIKLTEREGTGLVNLKKRYQLFGNNDVLIQQKESEFIVSIPLIKE